MVDIALFNKSFRNRVKDLKYYVCNNADNS